MKDTPVNVSPAPMEGRGAYNRHSQVQAAGLSPAVPLLQKAAEVVSVPGDEPIVIVDYGSSEGRNSLSPMGIAVRAFRNRVGLHRAISVVHTDLPGNDFSALFQTLCSDPASYLLNDSATFASGIGRSFYQQIMPTGSVTLGWSSWALQWLSRAPGPIPDQVQIAYSHDPEARARYTQQSAEDWENFLTSRGHELRPGGRIVILMMALHDDGDFGYRGVLTAMYAALFDLVTGGLITLQEASRMAIPTVGRSRADLTAPFSDGQHFAGLTIEHLEVFNGEDHIWQKFERDHDARKFGASWAAFSRASVFPSLAQGLDGSLNDPRATSFFEKLEAVMAARLAAAPEQMIIPLASIVLAKKED